MPSVGFLRFMERSEALGGGEPVRGGLARQWVGPPTGDRADTYDHDDAHARAANGAQHYKHNDPPVKSPLSIRRPQVNSTIDNPSANLQDDYPPPLA